MTCTGAICSVTGDAVAWVDDAIFRGEAFLHSQAKLAVNSLIGAVGVGCGWWRVAREGHQALADATDFDELCAELPGRLQRAQAKCREGSSTFAILGHSHDLGRQIICVFDSGDDFAPHLVTRWCAPYAEEIERADPASPFTPIDVARAQARLLPHAGLLTTAWLDGAGGIRTRVIHDLASDQAVAGPVRIGALAAKAAAA